MNAGMTGQQKRSCLAGTRICYMQALTDITYFALHLYSDFAVFYIILVTLQYSTSYSMWCGELTESCRLQRAESRQPSKNRKW